MVEPSPVSAEIFDDPLRYFSAMLGDIEKAKKYIYLEIYKFSDESVGTKFRDLLTKKAKQGVEVRLLIDSWGALFSSSFFAEFTKNGGQLLFFKKLKWTFDAFTKHHRRNHRKILVIDDHISYIGSANITDYSMNWRELAIRLEGNIARIFRRAFLGSWFIHDKVVFNIKKHTRTLAYGDFKLIRDIPSIRKQRIKKKFEELIKNAKREIIIETPYFLPGFLLRKHLMDAGKRGVDVKILTPDKSDVAMVDVLRSKYLGMLYHNSVKVIFYKPYNLHAKMLLVDGEVFCVGSANFDYRSFRYMHEIMLIGRDSQIIAALQQHAKETIAECVEFNYEKWLRRPVIHKLFEQILVPFRHLL
ncbi:MAG: phosphatidylserine/phosphatidylglycerophosphate/cardiolipin synthase family protein [Bacteroidota bacterium]